MTELESSLHLAQPPLYIGEAGIGRQFFLDAIKDCGKELTWDPAAILSILSFNYACGDRTLLKQVKRRPWLSNVGPDGEVSLAEIPAHGRLWKDHDEIADMFINLLCDEAVEACRHYKEIYVLLSGGLDSRVVGGILAKILKEGRLSTKPVAVTWGLEDCRDVAYGRETAKLLGFDWRYVTLGPDDLRNNIDEVVAIGNMVPPVHLHRMPWFKNVSKDALVIAGSYGDMVGRAEFSGRHLLEYNYLRPINQFGLMKPEVWCAAQSDLQQDLKALHARTPGQPKYVLCEHEMHGHYTRGMLNQAMSTINQYCKLYQMFTHPSVYGYIWSIHPALRFNEIYARTLEKLDPRLARLPWARTNRALKGKTVGAKSHLRKDFHRYPAWIAGELFDELNDYIEPQWFSATGVFDYESVENLAKLVRNGLQGKDLYGFTPYEKWIWLAGFRRMAEHLEGQGKSIELDERSAADSAPLSNRVPVMNRSVARRLLSHSDFLYKLARRSFVPFKNIITRLRRTILRYKSIRRYPPEKNV